VLPTPFDLPPDPGIDAEWRAIWETCHPWGYTQWIWQGKEDLIRGSGGVGLAACTYTGRG
jgi:hypothetical protein